MLKYFDGTWSNHSTVLPAKLSVNHPELIHIAPQSAFYDFVWSKEGIANLFETRVSVKNDVYSIHLWAHLWWDRSRKDFSRFHRGLLNHGYVNRAETTYAVCNWSFGVYQSQQKEKIVILFVFSEIIRTWIHCCITI